MSAAIPRGVPAAHLVDWLVGVGILTVLGWFRSRRTLPEAPRTVVILPATTIGDTLFTGTLIESLRAHWPDARLVSGAFPSSRPAVELLEQVDEIVALESWHPIRSLRRIRALEPDVVMDAGPWPKFTALMAALSGAWCVGFSRRGHPRHMAFDAVVEHRDDRHEIENQRALLEALMGPVGELAPPRLELAPVPPGVLPPGPFVVLHPWASGSGKRLKEWPRRGWTEVARWARSRGWSVALTGGPSDGEDSAALAEHLRAQGVDAVHDLAGSLTLAASGTLMREAELVVSVNTGTMHLAALLGCRVIGLHGPTDPARWGPVGPRARAVGPVEGGGFLSLGYEYRGAPRDTMERLAVEDVLAVADGLVDGEP